MKKQEGIFGLFVMILLIYGIFTYAAIGGVLPVFAEEATGELKSGGENRFQHRSAARPGTDTGSGADTRPGADTGTGTDARSGTNARPGADARPRTNTGTGTDARSGTGTVL